MTRGDRKNKVFRMIKDAGFEIENEEAFDIKENNESSSDKFSIDENPLSSTPRQLRPVQPVAVANMLVEEKFLALRQKQSPLHYAVEKASVKLMCATKLMDN